MLSVTDQNGNAITSSTHIGNLNPFRYRGYYLDTETGLYYLMSRYYDPVTHRFVNADGYFQSGNNVLDTNMSAYCGNNPIVRADFFGMCYEYVSLPGGVKGNKWFMKYQVPGVPDLCGYCYTYRPGSAGAQIQALPPKKAPTNWLIPSNVQASNEAMINTLEPSMQEPAREFLTKANDKGYALFITWARRTNEQEIEIKGWVNGPHTKGMAFDVAFWDPSYIGSWPGDPMTFHKTLDVGKGAYPDYSNPMWGEIGAIGREVGLLWGNDLYSFDPPHFELRP